MRLGQLVGGDEVPSMCAGMLNMGVGFFSAEVDPGRVNCFKVSVDVSDPKLIRRLALAGFDKEEVTA